MRALARIALVLAILALAGCATPAQQASAFARAQGFEEAIVPGNGFRHVVWRKSSARETAVLHVYLEGDGVPYLTRHLIARDPTPRHPLMLRLMSLDPYPSVYVGRPCYWGLADPACSAQSWTLERFSAPVVDSLVLVIEHEAQARRATQLVLYAHSGGAALALLAVQRGLPASAIITVGGTLDPDAWTRAHDYTSLQGLNPVNLPWPQTRPWMRHYVGSRDDVVPPALVRRAAQTLGGEVIEIPDFDHRCCWDRLWRSIVELPPAN